MAVPAVVGTVASRAVQFAVSKAPEALNAAKAYFESQGKDVMQLAASKSPAVQAAVVSTLLKSGLSASSFVEGSQLTPEEARQYAQLIAKFQVEQMSSVDSIQARKATSGDVFLDGLTTNREIDEILDMLGINSDQYAKLIRGVNTHTSRDIERFQLTNAQARKRFK